jgi:uncharacterized membrane protein YcaP (DUF421 family)
MKEWVIVLIRSIALFIGFLVVIKFIVRGSISKLNPFKYTTITIISIMAALISLNIVKNPALGILSILVWIILDIAVDFLSQKSKVFHDFISGKGVVVISHGKIMEESLFKQRMTGEELLSELRLKNAFNVSDVEFAVLEPTGDISLLFKNKETTAQLPEPQTVIIDGNIIYESLSKMGLNKQWLDTEIDKMELTLDNIFIGQVDSHGNLYVDLFDDKIKSPTIKVKQILYATLEKCQADLTIFYQETQNPKASEMYRKNAEAIEKVLTYLKPFL